MACTPSTMQPLGSPFVDANIYSQSLAKQLSVMPCEDPCRILLSRHLQALESELDRMFVQSSLEEVPIVRDAFLQQHQALMDYAETQDSFCEVGFWYDPVGGEHNYGTGVGELE